MRARPSLTPMHRGRLPSTPCRQHPLDGPERPSGRNACCAITPSTIMSPTRRPAGSRTEIRPGARAHHTRTSNRAHAPPTTNDVHINPDAALAETSLHR
jgi:hypothetical protein